MPAKKRSTSTTKRKSAPAKSKSATNTMSPTQKTIFNKLRRKGMSEELATKFSHHAAKRKAAAASKKAPAASRKPTTRSTSRKGKR